jgi:CMP/dCMP kinase
MTVNRRRRIAGTNDPTCHPVITIDGPAGAGKSSVARRLAQRLGYRFVPSGAIYRALAWRVAAGVPVEEALATTTVEFRGSPEDQRVLVNGEDVTEHLRAPQMSGLTSALSQNAEVRAFADALQRRLAADGPVVVEGRDAGTVVFPEAECKFYLDASLEVRAARRHADRRARGETADLAAVRDALAGRDLADESRAMAPLARSVDAIYVDSSGMTIDEVIELMAKEVERVCSTGS